MAGDVPPLTDKPPSRRWAWLRWAVLASLFMLLGVGAVAGTGLYYRADLLAWGIREGLARLGVAVPAFRIVRVGPGETRIEEIRLGRQLAMDGVSVLYRPADLVLGRLRQVVIEGLALDVTDPSSGLLGELRRRFENTDAHAAVPPLPEVRIRGARVFANRPVGVFEARLDGRLAPDLTGAFTASLDASAPFAEGHRAVLSELRAVLEIGAGGAVKTRLEGGWLTDASVGKSLFAPLALSGTGRFEGSKLAFDIGVKDGAGKPRLTLGGGFNAQTGAGRATLALNPIRFARGGEQPADLIPALALPAQVAGRLSGRAQIEWRGAWAKLRGEAGIDGFAVTFGGAALSEATARLEFGLGTDRVLPRIRFQGAKAIVAAAGQRFRLDRLDGGATLSLADDAFLLVLKGGRLAHLAPAPLFHPIVLAGGVDMDGDRVKFKGNLMAPARSRAVRVIFSGEHTLDTGKGWASLRLRPTKLSPVGLKPGDLAPALRALQAVSGEVAAGARMAWTAERWDGNGQLTLNGLDFGFQGAGVEGLAGVLQLDRLNPPTATKPQTLTARAVRGAVTLDAPRLTFRLPGSDGAGRIVIDHAEGGFAGGRLRLEESVIEHGTGRARFRLRLEAVDLGRLLALMNLDGVSASGRLTGALPVEIVGDRVQLAGGRLSADGPGVLKFRSAAAKRALAGAGEQAAMLLSVLEDFHYKRLFLDIANDAEGEAVLRLGTEGSNPAVKDGHPFILNINLTGNLERVLGAVLEIYRLSDQAVRATVGASK